MKIIVATIFVLMLILGYQITPSAGFIPNKLLEIASKAISFSLKDGITHEEMTRNALLEVAAEFLRENPNPSDAQSSQRLSALSSLDEKSLITAYYGNHDHTRIDAFVNAIEAIQEANSDTDFGEEQYLAAAHFGEEQFESGQNRLLNLRQSFVSSIMAGNVVEAREATGRFLHALQDFYSHTNWIENGNRAPNPVLGKPNQRIENIASPTQRTCTDCVKKGWLATKYYECNDNIDPRLKKDGILTSAYFGGVTDDAGREIKKPNGKCSHGGFLDPSRDMPARGGINKDGPYYMTSEHHYLHFEAAAVAQQATVDIFRDLRRAINNDQLFGRYLGVFQNQAIIECNSPIGSQAYLRGRIRNILLQHHMDRMNELQSQTDYDIEDKERIVAEIAELITKVKRIYQQEWRAKRQAKTRAKRSAPKQLEPKSQDKRAPKFSGTVPTSPLLPMELLMMIGVVVIYYFLY